MLTGLNNQSLFPYKNGNLTTWLVPILVPALLKGIQVP